MCWGCFPAVPEQYPSPWRTRYARRHPSGLPVQPREDNKLILHAVWEFRIINGEWSFYLYNGTQSLNNGTKRST
ncbi:hypothetical protein Bca4012_025167 [Brassica carinata]|uniref:Uncharacterized protein n=1 Tax=Brassica carinata TaxID=52824 RepID=A0A8X7VG63_BRACI|nr:hypothetical protein Bca52824_022223 [Brassica carinata]